MELKRRAAQAGLSVGAFLLGLALGDAAGRMIIGELADSDRKNEP